MPSEPPIPPLVSGLTWRPLVLADAAALAGLVAACAAVDGNPARPDTAAWAARLAEAGPARDEDTLAAIGPDGALAAYAWATDDVHFSHEYRVYLEGAVQPVWRGHGLGGFLLAWLEARGRPMAAARAAGRTTVLRIDTFDEHNEPAARLYARHGFRLAVAEDEMRRDLGALTPGPSPALGEGSQTGAPPAPAPARSLPPFEPPAGCRLESWAPDAAEAFFAVYTAAFRARPGFPDWSLGQWQAAFTHGAGFRPDLSRLLWCGDEPAGYTLCSVEAAETGAGEREGWILQMGVHPAWRRRGLAAALLVRALHDFAAEGLSCAMLSVNADNPAAAALYRRLGFVRVRRVSSYRKVG